MYVEWLIKNVVVFIVRIFHLIGIAVVAEELSDGLLLVRGEPLLPIAIEIIGAAVPQKTADLMAKCHETAVQTGIPWNNEARSQPHLLVAAEKRTMTVLEGGGEDGIPPLNISRQFPTRLKAETLLMHGTLAIKAILPTSRNLTKVVFHHRRRIFLRNYMDS